MKHRLLYKNETKMKESSTAELQQEEEEEEEEG